MNWRHFSTLKLSGFLLSILPLLTLGRINESDSCLGITSFASSYLQSTLGTSTNLVWNNNDGRGLEICTSPTGRSERSCCTKKHEALFKANAFKFISRFWPKTLSDVILAQSREIADQVTDLLAQTMDKVRFRLSHTYRVPERDYRTALTELFSNLSVSANFTVSSSATERHFESFFIELFPSVFVYQMSGDAGSRPFRGCLKANYNKFRPRPFLNLPADYGRHLHTVLSAYRLLLGTLRFSASLINATTSSSPSPACQRGLVRLRLCHLCGGQNVSRPCAGPCHNVHRGCFAHLLPLRRSWTEFVRAARELVDAVATKNNLINSLRQFDATIFKATQKAMFNVGKYGQQVVSFCTKPGAFGYHSKNKTSAVGQGRTAVPQKNMKEPEIVAPDLQPRLTVIRDLLTNNEAFFDKLPDQFCKGLRTRDCWNGTHQTAEGYYRQVWRFTDEEQENNMEVQRQAPATFPDSEVERRREELVEHAKRIVLFVSTQLLKPTPPERPDRRAPLPIMPRKKNRQQLPLIDGSGSGLGQIQPMIPRRSDINAPEDDDLVELSGSGGVQNTDPTPRLPMKEVTAPRYPQVRYDRRPENGAGQRPRSAAALLLFALPLRLLL